jgi:hypothetical protein
MVARGNDLAHLHLPFWYGALYATGGAGLSSRDSTGFWSNSWYSKNAVEDVGFMVTEAPLPT